jgi:hypothetical protein
MVEGYLEKMRQCLRQQGFARAGGADHEHIALVQHHIAGIFAVVDALVMVIDGHRDRFFRHLLTDDIIYPVRS